MRKNIVFVSFVLVGFLATLATFLLLSHQRIQVDLPRPTPTFSIDTPPTDSLSGTIATLSGTVQWESRSATESATITAVQKLQQGESLRTSTGSATFVFPGIVSVSLAEDTGINIIQTLAASFVLQQTSGNAVFSIASGSTPVSLRAMDLLMSTNSATLALEVDPKRAEVGVRVQEGSVNVAYEDTTFVTKFVTLMKGQTFYFNNNTKKQIYNFL